MLFYRSADLLITDEVVALREPRPARYRVDELTFVRYRMSIFGCPSLPTGATVPMPSMTSS